MPLELTDHHAIALTLWGESRSGPIEGRVSVASVIRNRLRTGRWGETYRSVCLAPWQFSCWKLQGGKENYEAVQNIAKKLTDDETPEDAALRECLWIAHGIIGEWIQDTVRRATHYHAASMKPKPYWANGKEPVCEISSHVFYVGIK